MEQKGQTCEFSPKETPFFPFLLFASYWKVLSESVKAFFGCLPPGGHGGEGMGSSQNSSGCSSLDSVQQQLLSLVVPRCLGSNPILVVSPEK